MRDLPVLETEAPMSSLHRGAKLGIGGTVLALAAAVGLGFAAPPQEEQLPTVEVWHDPT